MRILIKLQYIKKPNRNSRAENTTTKMKISLEGFNIRVEQKEEKYHLTLRQAN